MNVRKTKLGMPQLPPSHDLTPPSVPFVSHSDQLIRPFPKFMPSASGGLRGCDIFLLYSALISILVTLKIPSSAIEDSLYLPSVKSNLRGTGHTEMAGEEWS
jgi:hypothetical protein